MGPLKRMSLFQRVPFRSHIAGWGGIIPPTPNVGVIRRHAVIYRGMHIVGVRCQGRVLYFRSALSSPSPPRGIEPRWVLLAPSRSNGRRLSRNNLQSGAKMRLQTDGYVGVCCRPRDGEIYVLHVCMWTGRMKCTLKKKKRERLVHGCTHTAHTAHTAAHPFWGRPITMFCQAGCVPNEWALSLWSLTEAPSAVMCVRSHFLPHPVLIRETPLWLIVAEVIVPSAPFSILMDCIVIFVLLHLLHLRSSLLTPGSSLLRMSFPPSLPI